MRNKQFKTLLLILLHLAAITSCNSMTETILNYVEREETCSSWDVSHIGTGSLGGFFSEDDIWKIYAALRQKYPSYISEKIMIGETVQKRNIYGYFIGYDYETEDMNIVLVDALHHAREWVTLSMIVQITVEAMKTLNRCRHPFFENNRLFIVPIVNVDSFHFMCQSYHSDKWDQASQIRKNRRPAAHAICSQYADGVDLNRNYDIKFDFPVGASREECSDDYRGPKAFSEPETRAMRDLLDKFPRISSALNFHSYANLWIRPYSYNNVENNEIGRAHV